VRPLSLSHRAPAPPPAPPSTPNPAVPKVTLTPDLILSDYGSIISNLAGPDELRRMVRGMERNTWEAAALLRTHMRVEAALASRPPPRSRQARPRARLCARGAGRGGGGGRRADACGRPPNRLLLAVRVPGGRWGSSHRLSALRASPHRRVVFVVPVYNRLCVF